MIFEGVNFCYFIVTCLFFVTDLLPAFCFVYVNGYICSGNKSNNKTIWHVQKHKPKQKSL